MDALFAILFIFSVANHDPMQALTKRTWTSMDACEHELESETLKFAMVMKYRGIELVKTSAKCVRDPRQGSDA